MTNVRAVVEIGVKKNVIEMIVKSKKKVMVIWALGNEKIEAKMKRWTIIKIQSSNKALINKLKTKDSYHVGGHYKHE